MRVTTAINIAGTKSFRLSCSKVYDRIGLNFQNAPDEFLWCCAPSHKDWVFCQVDQEGAESMVVAYEAPPGRYRRLIELGIKPHIYVALNLFVDSFRDIFPRDRYLNRDPDELVQLPEWKNLVKQIKASKDEYYLGKVVNHARSYKMSWPTFRTTVLYQTRGRIALSPMEAKNFLLSWDNMFPEVITWQGKIEKQVYETRKLTNLFGFERQFFGLFSDALVREAISWIPQSTVGTITNIAFTKLFNYIEDNNKSWWLLGNKHDSYWLECPKEEAQEALGKMKEFINMDLCSTTGVSYRMRSTGYIGTNLLELNEV